MKKIILIISMIVVIIAQVFVIGKLFVDRYDIILGGDKFKFLVVDLDLSKAQSKGFVGFELKTDISGQGEYGIIKIDEAGFAEMNDVAVEKPSFGAYIKNNQDGYFQFPYCKYYLNDIIDVSESIVLPKDYKAYINVRIKEGNLELMDLIVNGKKIESYID